MTRAEWRRAVDAALVVPRAERGEVGQRIGATVGAEHDVVTVEVPVGGAARCGAAPAIAFVYAAIARAGLARILRVPRGERVREHLGFALGGGALVEVFELALHGGEHGAEQMDDIG
jgi:hypothetical protein